MHACPANVSIVGLDSRWLRAWIPPSDPSPGRRVQAFLDARARDGPNGVAFADRACGLVRLLLGIPARACLQYQDRRTSERDIQLSLDGWAGRRSSVVADRVVQRT